VTKQSKLTVFFNYIRLIKNLRVIIALFKTILIRKVFLVNSETAW